MPTLTTFSTLLLLVFGASLHAQTPQPTASHNFELTALGTFANQLEDTRNVFSGRGNFGFAAGYALHLPLGPKVSLETGAGLQGYFLSQGQEVRLGCNAPVGIGGQGRTAPSRIIGNSFLTTITVPVGLRYHFVDQTRGPYVKVGVQFGFDIGVNTSANLVECGQRNDLNLEIASDARVNTVVVMSGLAVGSHFTMGNNRLSYVELRVSGSLGQILSVDAEEFAINTMTDSGVLLIGLTVGQQFGGGKLARRTEQEARKMLKVN